MKTLLDADFPLFIKLDTVSNHIGIPNASILASSTLAAISTSLLPNLKPRLFSSQKTPKSL